MGRRKGRRNKEGRWEEKREEVIKKERWGEKKGGRNKEGRWEEEREEGIKKEDGKKKGRKE